MTQRYPVMGWADGGHINLLVQFKSHRIQGANITEALAIFRHIRVFGLAASLSGDMMNSAVPMAKIFADIHENNSWGSNESISGAGSEMANTSQLIRELPLLLRDLRIQTMLDLPCGDFNWMQHVDLAGIDYHGADIVDVLIEHNTVHHARPGRRFSRLDLLGDKLPQVDLILCRDCLFHFSNNDVFKSLHAFVDSQSKWLLTTTMIYRGLPRNADIQTGSWTTINLEMMPYLLPYPKRLLLEGNVTESVNYVGPQGVVQYPQNDRCLGLWFIDDIRETLTRIGR